MIISAYLSKYKTLVSDIEHISFHVVDFILKDSLIYIIDLKMYCFSNLTPNSLLTTYLKIAN